MADVYTQAIQRGFRTRRIVVVELDAEEAYEAGYLVDRLFPKSWRGFASDLEDAAREIEPPDEYEPKRGPI